MERSEIGNLNTSFAGIGIGRERGEGQQEDPYRASPYSIGREERRRAQQIAWFGYHCQRRCDAQHPQSFVAQENWFFQRRRGR